MQTGYFHILPRISTFYIIFAPQKIKEFKI